MSDRINVSSEPPMATCPNDGEPVVCTFEFPKYEFVCVVCGWLGGFLSPTPAEATPEIEARHAELQEQYRVERAARQEAAR